MGAGAAAGPRSVCDPASPVDLVVAGFSRRQRSKLVREIRRESFGISMLRRFRDAALRRNSTTAPPTEAPEPVMGQLSVWQPEQRYRPSRNAALTNVVEAARAAHLAKQRAEASAAGAPAIEDGSPAADGGSAGGGEESKGDPAQGGGKQEEQEQVTGASRRPSTRGSTRPSTRGSSGSRPATASEALLKGRKNRIKVR